METPFSSDKKSPFLAPYTPAQPPERGSGVKPFAAVDIAPPAADAGPAASGSPQASPFLPKDYGAFPPRKENAASPGPADPVERIPLEPAIAPAFALAVPPDTENHFGPGSEIATADLADPLLPADSPDLESMDPAPPRNAAGSSAVPRTGTSALPRTGTAAFPRTGTSAMPKAAIAGLPDSPSALDGGFPITTCPQVEGRSIRACLGVVSVEIVIPKDILFRNPAPYGELNRMKSAEELLQRVKRQAFEELSDRARALGADGIVGASLQFSQFDALVFLCAALGTAVKFSG